MTDAIAVSGYVLAAALAGLWWVDRTRLRDQEQRTREILDWGPAKRRSLECLIHDRGKSDD